MAMVGLFWIAEGDIYIGAKPVGLAPGIRLTPEGVLALHDGRSSLHLWEDVHSLTVTDIPLRTLRRRAGAIKDLALGTVLGMALPPDGGLLDETPPLMKVSLESGTTTHEFPVYAAAATGYTPTEVTLSHTLLTHLTEGAATMSTTLSTMSTWGRTTPTHSPTHQTQEQLLTTWTT
ncbi:hypothetical protein AB0D49_38600 [Streptomyces sp. NPDC048290]|uniref:hypothetical protein n=1 Tax=Streptomyces sp. NPDC048290 TaxID=3155811 RepID=UPI003427F705